MKVTTEKSINKQNAMGLQRKKAVCIYIIA